ncbi:hypothetical protein BJY52DRAFT_656577 [Lactarius psammicola]|nr:hypothetical protein BJY52DRAFT_656577 [Lactarius psammicola]
MATSRMFLPLMLSDRTGSVFGSEFTELYGRMYLCVRRTCRDSDGATQYGIYNTPVTPFNSPTATLNYGAGGALGTVTFTGPGGSARTHTMSSFLTVVGGPRHRKFTGSDGNEYIWGWRTNTQDSLEEWTCVKSNGDTVAWYALGVPGEVYETASGCAFGVEEPYQHLAVEFLATLLIMRYIATLEK